MHPLRSLLKTPGFTIVAILTMAVGIGANTALFSVFDRLILRPVTVPQPDRLVALWVNNPSLSFNAPALSWPRFEEVRRHATSFSSVADSAFDNFTLTGRGDPEQLNGLRVTADFFATLGVRPLHGRGFVEEDDQPNGPNVCLLSHELWQTRFGGDEAVVGSQIQLNGLSWQVIGILPPHLTNPYGQVQVFAPRVFEVTGLTAVQVQNGAGYTQPIARLKPGVTLEQAAAELVALGQAYAREFPTRLDANNTCVPRGFVEALVGQLRPTFYTLLGAVAFVLLIACANIASLFLGRLVARHKEIAIRQSLGATRWAIVRQFLAESLLFSALAGGLGLLLALWALAAIESNVASLLPPNTALTLDWSALAFTAGLTFASGLLVGLVPALQASKTNLVEVLKDCNRCSTGRQGGNFRSSLIVGEVALSVILLVGSSLLLLSFLRLQRTPPGFDPKGVASAFIGIPPSRYPTNAEQARFFTLVLEQLRANPQVRDASASLGLPIGGFLSRSPYSVSGRPILPLAQRPLAGFQVVSNDFFRLLHIPLREGRTFTPDDRDGGPGVCVVNESFAKHVFPGESAVGKVLLRGRDADIKVEVVGVIGDVKSAGLNSPVPDEVYYPMSQLGRPGMVVSVRTEVDPNAMQAVIRSAVAAVDKDQPISFFQTMQAAVDQSLGAQRIVATLTAIFAGIALLLAAVGLYSVLAYAVTQRTSEIGIRMALGSPRRAVIALVMRSGLRLVALGLAVGLLGAVGVAQLIRSLLFDVTPLHPGVYAGVALLFALVSAAACLVPSLRASRIDPLVALRTD
ncbi:MAG: ABC transporter permease [Verrucomicrobia bacterium]|nr:ABC transporter permease [Verrucomicrobiota bacterium]